MEECTSLKSYNAPVRPFLYPSVVMVRKHEPQYITYESYRDWARDDFDFRCAYCLHRETFTSFKSCFDLDHSVPQVEDATLTYNYNNIIYSCRRCNATKNKWFVISPGDRAYGEMLEVNESGVVVALNDDGELIIEAFGLNEPEFVYFRHKIIRLSNLFAQLNDLKEMNDWFGLPPIIPNLRKLRPDSNLKPAGLDISWYFHQDKWNYEVEPRHQELRPEPTV